jgi:hypothetical protein
MYITNYDYILPVFGVRSVVIRYSSTVVLVMKREGTRDFFHVKYKRAQYTQSSVLFALCMILFWIYVLL